MYRLRQNVHNKSRKPADNTQLDLVTRLTSADENLRQDAIASVLEEPRPEVRERIINRLVDLLPAQREAMYHRVADSLTEMGSAAVPVLLYRLFNDVDAVIQIRLVEVLARIGKTLPPDGRLEIETELDAALRIVQSMVVAIEDAQLELGRTEEETDEEW